MDIRQEINRHIEWMERLVALLASEEITDEEVDEISQHDRCALGHWLDSDEAAEFRDLPELEKLRESHEAFHNMAGTLVSAIVAGDEAEALKSQKGFIELSQDVIGYLYVLEVRSKKGGDEGP